ncbi:MAG TPA: acetate kinase [Bryobacteraceae bacterium]|nr:acetate kinase [Bryobacteraceae bacterium]
MKALVLNAGSSSLKVMLWQVEGTLPSMPPKALWRKHVEWHDKAIEFDSVLGSIPDAASIDVVGHRIVHGGSRFRESTRITPEVRDAIAKMGEFAPEHNRVELAGIQAVERVLRPDTPQVAVFDTAFHATLAPPAYVYPGPYEWVDQGIRRYGFHGISHQYVSRRAAEMLGRDLKSLRLVTCHLGNGCSLAAIRNGASVDTTMGFTPLDGVMMGSRSGSVDPGILIALVRDQGYTADRLDHTLNEESGLKGVSGVSSDMREVLAAIEMGNERARLAFDVYTHRLIQEIGAMIASVGGIDALIFTAGVGENCAPLREIVCRQFSFLGIAIDPARNAETPVDAEISSADSGARILVIHTEEDWEIARECCRLYNRD